MNKREYIIVISTGMYSKLEGLYMSYHKPQHIAELTVETGYKKATLPL
jgi:hypothetical protein